MDGVVFATPGTTHHELAHAANCEWRSGSAPAFQEGLAVNFEITKLTAKTDPYDFVLAAKPKGLDYDAAGHFVRWLLETHDVAAFRELFETAPRNGGEQVLDVLESVYGKSADELFAEYDETAPYMWIPHRQCTDIDTLEPQAGVWEFNAIFDCDDPSTFGPDEREGTDISYDYLATTAVYQSFLIDIETPGHYLFEREFDTWLQIERCLDQPSLTEAEAETLWQHDWLFPTLQGTTDVKLRAGTYRVDVRRQYTEPVPVWMRITGVGQ
jgi:hypothetical protein